MSDYNELLNSLKAAAGSAANIARDFAGNAGEKARDLAGNAGEKAKAAARIAKLTLELNSVRSDRDDAFTEIGRVYFEGADKKNPGDLYVRLFDKVMLSNASIERIETEIRELRAAFGDPDMGADEFVSVVDSAEADATAADDGDIEVEITEEAPEDDQPEE